MIKKIYTAAAVLLALSMTACGGDSGSAENEASALSTAAAETSAAESSVTETSAATTEEITADASETAETDGDNTFRSKGYTISVDPTVWVDCTDYFLSLSGFSEDLEKYDVEYSDDEVKDMIDALFCHIDGNRANFNIVITKVGEVGDDFDIGILEPPLREYFEQFETVTYLGGEVVSVNGYDSVKIEYEEEYEGSIMKKVQYTFVENTFKYVITYTSTKDDYSLFLPDFEMVMQSVKFE